MAKKHSTHSKRLRSALIRPALRRLRRAHDPPTKQQDFTPQKSINRRSSPPTSEPPSLILHLFKPPPCPPAYFQTLIDAALSTAWSESTIKSYSTGINAYFAFCRLHSLPMRLAFPVTEYMLCAFIATRQSLSPQTLSNYVSGIRTLHTRANLPFPTSDRISTLIRSAKSLRPQPPKKNAVTLEMLEALSSAINHTDPFDMTVLCCASLAFWGLCRLGELLPADMSDSYDESKFPLVKNAFLSTTDLVSLNLPWTKVTKSVGAEVSISSQHGPSDPVLCFQSFRDTVQTPSFWPLFSFKTQTGRSILTKRTFLRRCNDIWTNQGFPRLTGHSFRIGGATHLLLCEIDPSIVKKYGRWSSDSFLRYWRNLGTILPSHVRFATPAQPAPRRVHRDAGASAAAAPLVLGQPVVPSVPSGCPDLRTPDPGAPSPIKGNEEREDSGP